MPSIVAPEGSRLIVRLYDTVRATNVHETRFSNLARHCDNLLSVVREYSPLNVGAEADIEARADAIERAVESVLVRVSGWARLNKMAAFLRQNEIQNGIEDCHRELEACYNRFMVALSTVTRKESEIQEMARQRDHQQMLDKIADLREEMQNRERSITLEAPPWHELPPQPGVVEVDGQGDVPAVSADYSGKVSRVSEDPVCKGSQLVFYTGELTERTALGCIKDQSPDSQKRFKKWIESSHGLRHRNILNFFGHVTIDDVIYSVNPWMEHGNAREYIKRNPDVNRVRLLSQAASGVEFLHERDIVHGDLCDKNILINHDGEAVVCGFDLFDFSNPVETVESRARWLAPERITTTSVASPTEKADIWSFGLLCLEVFTGEDPYHPYSDFYVGGQLAQGFPPEYPKSAAVGLSSEMWVLMRSCWQFVPAERPSMSGIRSKICEMLLPHDSSMAILRTVDQRADTQAPIRRETDPPSLGFPHLPRQAPRSHPDMLGSLLSVSSLQRTTPGRSQQMRSSTDPNPSASIPQWPLVGFSLSQSTSRMSETNERRLFPFAPISSQTILGTIPSLNNNPPLPGFTSNSGYSSFISSKTSFSNWCNFSNASEDDYKLNEKNSEASFECSSLQSISSAGESNIRRRSQTLCIILPQSRDWESVTPVGLDLLEKATTDSESSLRTATDGTVLAGNLEGFVSRVISEIADSSRNDGFRATFLTIYQLFATNEQLLNILKRRFETSPATVDSRYFILLFIESWLKKGFGDEELKYSSMIKEFIFALVGGSESVSEKLEAKAGEILSLIEDPHYVHLRQPMCCAPLRVESVERPQGMKPADLAAALAVVAGVRFKCITHWDYVNFTRQRSNVQRIKAFNFIHDLVTSWVQTTILQPDSIDERMKTYEEWIYTAEACRALNDFSSTSAIVVALMSQIVRVLALPCDSKAKQVLYALAKELSELRPTDGVYQSTLKTVATNDLIPWLDLHLSTLNLTANSNLIVEVDGHPLINFRQCSEVAEQIEALVQYSPPTHNTARPDVLAYVEYSLKSSDGDDTQRSAEERSADPASEELEQQNSGFAWPTP